MKELFWQIDRHGDPFGAEVIKTKFGSYCIKQEKCGEEEYEFFEFESAPEQPFYDEKIAWKKIDWEKHGIYGRHNIEVALEK